MHNVGACMSCNRAVIRYVQEGIVQEAQQQMALPPTDLLKEEGQQFRRVSATGHYHHDEAVFVGPRPLR